MGPLGSIWSNPWSLIITTTTTSKPSSSPREFLLKSLLLLLASIFIQPWVLVSLSLSQIHYCFIFNFFRLGTGLFFFLGKLELELGLVRSSFVDSVNGKIGIRYIMPGSYICFWMVVLAYATVGFFYWMYFLLQLFLWGLNRIIFA